MLKFIWLNGLKSSMRQPGYGLRRPGARRRAKAALPQAVETCEARQVLSAAMVAIAFSEMTEVEIPVNYDRADCASRLRGDADGQFRFHRPDQIGRVGTDEWRGAGDMIDVGPC